MDIHKETLKFAGLCQKILKTNLDRLESKSDVLNIDFCLLAFNI